MTTENTNGDQHVADPNSRWVFDEKVTQNFLPMLQASIPGYEDMRRFTLDMANHAMRWFEQSQRGKAPVPATVLDLGSSRGDAVAPLIDLHADAKFVLCEVSRPMLDTLEHRFGDLERVELVCADLSEDVGWLRTYRPNLVTSILTLMFVPIECRQRLVQAVFDCMVPGGTLLVSEKTLGDTPATQQLLVDSYHQFKVGNGYSQDAVERKRMSLKGALVSCKAEWVETCYATRGSFTCSSTTVPCSSSAGLPASPYSHLEEAVR